MGWKPHWTKGAWADVSHLGGGMPGRLMKAVRDFAATGVGLTPDEQAPGIGWLSVDIYEIEIVRQVEHAFLNEDGEEIRLFDAIVVLSVVAVDPNP